MSFERPRAGIFAIVGGREFAAESYPENGVVTLVSDAQDNPDPDVFGRDERADRWRAEVLTDDCERLDEVTTRANCQGHECQVVAIEADGSVGLHYLGPEKARAARDGFVQVEPGVWARTVSIYDLSSLWEHHADLLFAEWVASLR